MGVKKGEEREWNIWKNKEKKKPLNKLGFSLNDEELKELNEIRTLKGVTIREVIIKGIKAIKEEK